MSRYQAVQIPVLLDEKQQHDKTCAQAAATKLTKPQHNYKSCITMTGHPVLQVPSVKYSMTTQFSKHGNVHSMPDIIASAVRTSYSYYN
jgi:hypothetical protein